MSRTTITVEQYEAAMDWQRIVRAAGLHNPSHYPFQSYQLARIIMRDDEVRYRVLHSPAAAASAFVPRGAYERALNEMTDAERAALKARIVAQLSK